MDFKGHLFFVGVALFLTDVAHGQPVTMPVGCVRTSNCTLIVTWQCNYTTEQITFTMTRDTMMGTEIFGIGLSTDPNPPPPDGFDFIGALQVIVGSFQTRSPTDSHFSGTPNKQTDASNDLTLIGTGFDGPGDNEISMQRDFDTTDSDDATFPGTFYIYLETALTSSNEQMSQISEFKYDICPDLSILQTLKDLLKNCIDHLMDLIGQVKRLRDAIGSDPSDERLRKIDVILSKLEAIKSRLQGQLTNLCREQPPPFILQELMYAMGNINPLLRSLADCLKELITFTSNSGDLVDFTDQDEKQRLLECFEVILNCASPSNLAATRGMLGKLSPALIQITGLVKDKADTFNPPLGMSALEMLKNILESLISSLQKLLSLLKQLLDSIPDADPRKQDLENKINWLNSSISGLQGTLEQLCQDGLGQDDFLDLLRQLRMQLHELVCKLIDICDLIFHPIPNTTPPIPPIIEVDVRLRDELKEELNKLKEATSDSTLSSLDPLKTFLHLVTKVILKVEDSINPNFLICPKEPFWINFFGKKTCMCKTERDCDANQLCCKSSFFGKCVCLNAVYKLKNPMQQGLEGNTKRCNNDNRPSPVCKHPAVVNKGDALYPCREDGNCPKHYICCPIKDCPSKHCVPIS